MSYKLSREVQKEVALGSQLLVDRESDGLLVAMNLSETNNTDVFTEEGRNGDVDISDNCDAVDVYHEVLESEPKSIVLGILKQLRLGADLSKITLPVFVLEPRSLLEKITDFMTYPDLLIHNNYEENDVNRFLNVVLYFLSSWHIRPKGVKKPYNPILNEYFRCYWDIPSSLSRNSDYLKKEKDRDDTAEYTRWPINKLESKCDLCKNEIKSRSYYFSEQVSHHPPISSYFYCNPDHGVFIQGNFKPKGKFLGNSAASLMDGSSVIVFSKRPDEFYSVSNPNMYIRGIILGSMHTELGDVATIMCHSTGLYVNLEFKTKGYFLGSYNTISGIIKRKSSDGGQDTPLFNITGKWSNKIFITPINNKKGAEHSMSMNSVSSEIKAGDNCKETFNECHNGTQFLLMDVLKDNIKVKKEIPKSTKDKNPIKHRYESRRLWRHTTECLVKKDYERAGLEKTKLENIQRERFTRIKEALYTYNRNYDNKDILEVNIRDNIKLVFGPEAIPYKTRYFSTEDGISWKFMKIPLPNLNIRYRSKKNQEFTLDSDELPRHTIEMIRRENTDNLKKALEDMIIEEDVFGDSLEHLIRKYTKCTSVSN